MHARESTRADKLGQEQSVGGTNRGENPGRRVGRGGVESGLIDDGTALGTVSNAVEGCLSWSGGGRSTSWRVCVLLTTDNECMMR